MVIDIQNQIEQFKDFIETVYSKNLTNIIEKGERSILLDFQELSKFDIELAEQIISEPTESIQNAEIALTQIDILKDLSLKARFCNLPVASKLQIRDIRSVDLGNFVYIEGIIRQASDVRPQVVSAKFECPSCGNTISVLQLDSQFKEPSRCSCGRKGKFRLISKVLVDAQHLKIEEAPENLEGGSQPKRLSVFLKEDLVEPRLEKRTTPGSKVLVVGVIKEIPKTSHSGATLTRFEIAMDANYVKPLQESFEEIEISKEEEKEIKEISADPKFYSRMVASIAPSIYGHEKIKEALLLQLVGGTRKIMEDKVIRRGDIHILLVGDPGSGKSQMLQFISKAAPKGRFVSGKGASGAGITAAVVKDDVLKGYALEAGAIVLANHGICVIDELDKMTSEDRSALHEAMEQQTITISKANIQATLRAETTVLAAANPKLGRFDPYTPLASQIDLPPTLINRFDLIFPIRDIPNKDIDEKIARHVLSIHQKPETLVTEIHQDLFRKYISYAKQRIKPELTEGAMEEIKNFYVSLRNSGQESDENIKPIPISARQLEALIRLSESSAKLRLSKKVTKRDAKKAIELLRYCLIKVGMDQETGQIDIDRISTGLPASQRGRIVSIKEIIYDLEKRGMKSIPLEDISAEAAERGIDEEKVEEAIERMKREGLIFEPKRGFIQRI
ncbi:MAG: minichromosome maintenance protein MCM [Nanoarchaeota archaeon]